MTNKEELKEELKIYKERLEGAMAAGNLAWWEMELPSGKVKFNERKATMLGYPPEKFSHYTDFTDLLHPEDHDRVMKAMRDYLEGRAEKYEIEYRIEKKGGDYKWFRDVVGITEEGEDGDYKKVTGIVIDIDDRKEVEKELRESEKKYRSIFEQFQDLYYRTDMDGIIKEVSPSVKTLTGYERDELIGKPVKAVYSNPDDRENLLQELHRKDEWKIMN